MRSMSSQGGDQRSGAKPRSVRSRLGCITCRRRKVKCPSLLEDGPVCTNCNRLKLQCRWGDLPSTSQTGKQNVKGRSKEGHSQAALNTQAAAIDTVSELQIASGNRLLEPLNPSQFTFGEDFWNLDLLHQESVWSQLPVFSNDASLESYELWNPAATEPLDDQYWLNSQQSPSSSISLSDIDPSELALLRHFVSFAIPEILVGVEPRWNHARKTLLRTAQSDSLVRHAICSFSALSLSQHEKDQPAEYNARCMHFYDLALRELNETYNSRSTDSSNENILASIFFLSYVELLMSSRPKQVLELLRRAHTIYKTSRGSLKTPLGNQLRIWLKLLDAKVVSAGGEGIHLSGNPDLRDFEGPSEEPDIVEQPNGPSPHEVPSKSSDPADVIFECINHSSYNYYLEVLDFAGRIARLDPHHRSRGAPSDELEVMVAAEQIAKDLKALYARRPAMLDLAFQENGAISQYLNSTISGKVEVHLRVYVANYYACFVHLQRACYPYLPTAESTKFAVEQILALIRLFDTDFESLSRLSVSMLWPLMMAGCEVQDKATRNWIISTVEGMSERVGNASRTAKLIREICRQQDEKGQRADARTVMQEVFGTVFAII